MAYSDLAYNQTVSFNNLQSGVTQGYFDAKTTIPSSNMETTKAAAFTYVDIDPTYPPYAVKLDNQLVVKSDLRDNVAEISISNGFFTGTVTDITVNGVSITGATFPLDIGNGTQGFTDQLGTYDIVLYYADADMPSNYARIYDSDFNTICIDGFTSLGPGPYYVTFPSQVVNTLGGIYIETGDGSCTAPIYPSISGPIGAVAVNRGSGQYMAVGVSNANRPYGTPVEAGPIYISSDYGVSWLYRGFINYWKTIRMSDNGQYMVGLPQFGNAYISIDYGNTWAIISATATYGGNTYNVGISGTFGDAALSDNGQRIIITNQTGSGTLKNNFAFLSNDYGATWSVTKYNTFDEKPFYGASMSSNGAYMFLSGGKGKIYRSVNYGTSWVEMYSDINEITWDIKCIADGSKIMVAKAGYSVFTSTDSNLMSSTDYGVTWTDVTGGGATKPWYACMINTSGTPGTGYGIYDTFNSTSLFYLAKATSLNTIGNVSSAGTSHWTCLANSNNGTYMLVGAYNGLIKSSDGGVTWVSLS